MHVSAKDLATGREQKMTVTGGSALPKDDIDRMMREAEQYAEEDRRRREAAETRNQAEQLVYQTENFLRENGDKVPGDTRSEVEEAVTALKGLLGQENTDTAELRTGVEKLASVSQRMGQAMYAQTASAPRARPPARAHRRRRTTAWWTRRSSTTTRTPVREPQGRRRLSPHPRPARAGVGRAGRAHAVRRGRGRR